MNKPLCFATYLAPNMFPVYQFIARYIGERLGIPTGLVIGSAFDQFANGDVDVGFICGLPFVQLAGQSLPPVEALAAPVLEGDRYQDRPVNFSDVIVRKDQPYRSFAGLRGCSWSYNDPDSQSGYGITRYWLVRMGETKGFFGRVVQAGFHQESIRMVASGQVDASAIDSQVLAIELRDHPELAENIKVIDSLGPSTIQPVVAASRLPDHLKSELRRALIEMGEDAEARRQLARGLIRRFAAVNDSTYDDIREMLNESEAAGFMVIR